MAYNIVVTAERKKIWIDLFNICCLKREISRLQKMFLGILKRQ